MIVYGLRSAVNYVFPGSFPNHAFWASESSEADKILQVNLALRTIVLSYRGDLEKLSRLGPQLLLAAALLLSCAGVLSGAPQEPALSGPGRIYAIKGKRQELGEYHGELELRPITGRRVSAVRVVEYDKFKFESRKVQEIWSGTGELAGNKLSLEFKLKQADIFDRVDQYKRQDWQFARPLVVKYSVQLSDPLANAKIHIPDLCKEQLSAPHSAATKALWQDERKALLSKGDCFQIVGKWAKLSLFLPMTAKLQFDPLIQPYLQRPEFVSENQYFIFDPTDFEFLQLHPDYLRVNNKVLDFISLVEATCRAEAYGPSLAQKDKEFEEQMRSNHLNALGLYSGVVFDTSTNTRVGFTPNGDGALWSGMYAGSQAMRYLVTKDKQALENFRRVAKAVMRLMDYTGNPAEFARTAEPMAAGEALKEPWRQAVAPYQQIKYCEGGNNDMVKGVFHAFAWAFDILPENDPLLHEIAEHAKRLPELRVASREKKHPGNAFAAAGLAALASGKKEDLQKYLSFYNSVMRPVAYSNFDKGFYFGGIADWSGVNLGMVAQLSDILVAKNLLRRCTAEGASEREAVRSVLKDLRQRLINTWTIYEPAKRDFITIAANAFAVADPVELNFPEGTAATEWIRKEKWKTSRADSVWSLREMPMVPARHQLHFDYRRKPEWCASAWPLRPWKMFVEDTTVEYHLQGAYNYPLFEGHAYETDIVWTSAFMYDGAAGPDPKSKLDHQHGRFDFLHTYWLARLSGLVTGSD